MAKREQKKATVFREVTDMLEKKILEMEIGDRASINPMVCYHYAQLGYERKHLGFDIGYGLTRDNGTTYLLSETDLLEVLDRLEKKLKGKRKLDFSDYEDMYVGLPYNLTFVIREDNASNNRGDKEGEDRQ